MSSNLRTVGAAQYHLTQEQREKIREALYNRALKEITEGSMKEAQIAVEMMDREGMGEDTAAKVLAALLGDDRVPDEA